VTKEKKKEKASKPIENNPEQHDKQKSLLKESKKEYEIENKTEEIKQIEQKEEQLQLEYFSKEELGKQITELKEALKEREDELHKYMEERDKFKSRMLHTQADFENAQKRWEKNRQELRIQYTASVLKSFLPLYDSFKKALETEAEKENGPLHQFYTQFMNILKSQGAEPMEVNNGDPFDYNSHEALTSVENAELPENSIVDVIQEGWKLNKDILRYAKVVISKKPKPPEPEPDPNPSKEELSEEEEEEHLDDAEINEEQSGEE